MLHGNEVCVVKPEDPVDPLLLTGLDIGSRNVLTTVS